MKAFVALAALCVAAAAPAQTELKPEQLHVETLPEPMRPHWVWLNDVSFDRIVDGRAYLVDADSGQMLGMVSGGYNHSVLMLAPDGKSFAVPSSFMSRGTRGTRTDVVTFYKMSDLAPGREIIIPPKRYGGMPFVAASPVMPGGRYGIVYNFTPEQSVSVIDLQKQTFVGDTLTPGCGLIFPTGPSKFFLICSDGALQPAVLDAGGKVSLGEATKPLFASDDPVSEKGVWTGSQWLFFTMAGKVYVIDHGKAMPTVTKSWSLVMSPADKGWRPGAVQTAAYYRKTGRLFVLMHKGGPNTHKDPGSEIWVYDAASQKRIDRYTLDTPAMSVAVSQDAAPLLYTTAFGETSLKVRDAMTGKLIRKIDGFGTTMTVIQPAPVAGQ